MSAEQVQTLDLKSYVGPSSPVERLGADWPMLHGREVLDGIPFQVDGTILFQATNALQKGLAVTTNLSDLAVGRRFERLHLLAGTDTDGPDGIVIAKIHLLYADGTDAALELKYGEHLRCWRAAWHKDEEPLKSPDARVVWREQSSSAAQLDKYLRLFHVALTNPAPDKEVRALSIESAQTQYGLLLFAVSIGPTAAEPLPDTVTAPHSPFPDLRPRQGEPAQGEGVVKDKNGRLLVGARIRVSETR
ncbi:MAG: hypothetical protein JWQ04_3386, partial [Pedosphaera sp.]|nr:hypothetical protein [Pedosphaera sp.]